jgi:hypothetical protein
MGGPGSGRHPDPINFLPGNQPITEVGTEGFTLPNMSAIRPNSSALKTDAGDTIFWSGRASVAGLSTGDSIIKIYPTNQGNDYGYTQIAWYPEADYTKVEGNVLLNVHKILADDGVSVHRHLSIYTNNLAGNHKKRLNIGYLQNISDMDFLNSNVLISYDTGNETTTNALQINHKLNSASEVFAQTVTCTNSGASVTAGISVVVANTTDRAFNTNGTLTGSTMFYRDATAPTVSQTIASGATFVSGGALWYKGSTTQTQLAPA